MIKYTIVFLVLIVASYLYLKIAKKFKIIDKPNERSSHSIVIIRGGGIIFPVAILLFFFFNGCQYPYFLLGIFLVSVISFLDDIYTLSSKIRFPFQLFAVYLILYQVGVPFHFLFFCYLITGVGIVNMFNFMDGINGITGIYSLVVLLGLYFINLNEHLIDSNLIIYSGIAIAVFGFYNFRKKAIFFAGDIGSITIGMLVFFIGLLFTIQLKSPLILLIVIVYGADAGNTLIYRKFFTKESIYEPHRHHLYQKFVDVKKIAHIKISIIYSSIQLVVNFIIYKSYKLGLNEQFVIFFTLIVLFIISYIYLFKALNVKD